MQIHVFKNSFLTFLINFMFLTFFWFFCQKKKKKSDFLAKEPLKSFLSFFGQNSDNLDRFLVKFHSKLNIFIYHTILIFKLWQQQFSPKLPNCTHITSMNERYVREFRDGREFRDVPELRVPPNWHGKHHHFSLQINTLLMLFTRTYVCSDCSCELKFHLVHFSFSHEILTTFEIHLS